jgi:hypothetical protein
MALRFATLIAWLLLAGCSSMHPAAAGPPASSEAEALGVALSAHLRQVGVTALPDTLVVLAHPAYIVAVADSEFIFPRVPWDSVPATLRERFLRALAIGEPPPRHFPRPVRWVDSDSTARANVVFALSPLVVSGDGQALIYSELLCGATCGGGTIFWLQWSSRDLDRAQPVRPLDLVARLPSNWCMQLTERALPAVRLADDSARPTLAAKQRFRSAPGQIGSARSAADAQSR